MLSIKSGNSPFIAATLDEAVLTEAAGNWFIFGSWELIIATSLSSLVTGRLALDSVKLEPLLSEDVRWLLAVLGILSMTSMDFFLLSSLLYFFESITLFSPFWWLVIFLQDWTLGFSVFTFLTESIFCEVEESATGKNSFLTLQLSSSSHAFFLKLLFLPMNFPVLGICFKFEVSEFDELQYFCW